MAGKLGIIVFQIDSLSIVISNLMFSTLELIHLISLSVFTPHTWPTSEDNARKGLPVIVERLSGKLLHQGSRQVDSRLYQLPDTEHQQLLNHRRVQSNSLHYLLTRKFPRI